ncbi:hypothetical protein [Tenacibaculum aiptasiae]|uniref:hypothetical protein n=1 Tax=Tenacibaculum aiptasiae TaxID=426481 RepID=UPI00232C0023|nr:hypothetical protein [Tenacibaculum aiptasiae]
MSKTDYKKKFEESELISDELKKRKPNLIKELEKEAEQNEKLFREEIEPIDLCKVENTFSQFALS